MIGEVTILEPWVAAQQGVFLLLLMACGLTDLLTGRILNVITVPAAATGLALNAALAGWRGLGSSLLGLVAGLGLLGVVWLAGGIGGGDVKLMAAVGALQGLPFVLWAAVLSVLAGGVLSMVFLTYHRRLIRSGGNVCRTLTSILTPSLIAERPDPQESEPIPFGFAIVLGSLWCLLAF